MLLPSPVYLPFDVLSHFTRRQYDVVCLPGVNSKGVLTIAKELSEQIKREEFFVEKDPRHPYKTTVSIGILTYPQDNIKDKNKLLDYLEMSLINAKSKGKNQIEVY